MKQDNLANRIKELRVRHGYSQESLANETNLGLRTIQRIENGESVPRGDTLQKISKALKTSPDELLDWSLAKDNGFLLLLALSPLSFLIFPLLGIIVPLVLWITKRHKIEGVDRYGKKILNFQITWTGFLFLFYIFSILAVLRVIRVDLSFFNPLGQISLLSIALVLLVVNILFSVINAIRVYKQKRVWYPAIPLLR
ncbi:helix-turn-helix domain-containing protein [Aquimarina brevivitae]|uniref:Putative Tic20 family protein n=1 Tax=Aquimarina brevivitae TaxID=323412 RepID=A0A4Q7PJQ6_9FLAO|nr:helix-turn-helix domain-containing protein [Aquimarina brevivitae]RZS99142.1 putative Tic20 family protein [Aquimarina brevivitae]